MPCTADIAAPATSKANVGAADTELPSPVEIVEQRTLRKAKKVALFLAYNGKGYLVRHCCCSMHGHVLLMLFWICGRWTWPVQAERERASAGLASQPAESHAEAHA